MNKYLYGVVTGMVVGASVGMMVVPQLDRKTQKTMKKAGRKVINFAGDSYEGIMGMKD